MDVRVFVLIARYLVLAGEALPPSGPSPAPLEGSAILFLGVTDERRAVDETALLDAVAIYTRDLGVTVLRANDRRRPLADTGSLADVAELLRARNARLAFWCQTYTDPRSIELMVTDGRRYTVRAAFAQEGPVGPEIYRAVALKLRAALTAPDVSTAEPLASRDREDRETSRTQGGPLRRAPSGAPSAAVVDGAADAKAPGGERAPATEPPGSGKPPSPVADAPAGAARREATPPRPPGSGTAAPPRADTSFGDSSDRRSPHPFSISIDYALSRPSGSAPWRNAAALHWMTGMTGMTRMTGTTDRRPDIEIDVGLEVAPAGERAISSGSVSVTDVPLRLGVRLVRRASVYWLAAGALAGVHVLFATATAAPPDRASESSRTVAASLGLEILARGPSIHGFAPELRVFGEANAPNTRFRVGGATALEPGAFTVGLALGVVIPAP